MSRLPRPEACRGCPLDRTDKPGWGPGGGFVPVDRVNSKTSLVVWGEAPGYEEEYRGLGFVGPSGKVLRKAERLTGLRVWDGWTGAPSSDDQVAHRNVVMCRPSGNKFPGLEIAKECLARHQALDLMVLGASKMPWLICGANATEALTGFKFPVTKGGPGILRVRGSLLPTPQGWATVTYHPAMLLHGQSEENKGAAKLTPLLGQDVWRALNQTVPVVPRVQFGPPERFPIQEVDKVFAIDIEGGLGCPTLVGISWREGHAYVMRWSERARVLVQRLFDNYIAILHNAPFDIPELQAAGVRPPPQWVDTINLAALYDPGLPKNLEAQALAWVLGSTTWKGLINHEHGDDFVGPVQAQYRELWTTILTRLGRPVPRSGTEWGIFYNGLDVERTFCVGKVLKLRLEQQGRLNYYTSVMAPNQYRLLAMGQGGLPYKAARLEHHKKACQRLQRIAQGILNEAGMAMLREKSREADANLRVREAVREQERKEKGKRVKFSEATQLAKERMVARTLQWQLEAGFNADSHPQRCELLYGWYGLPPVLQEKRSDRRMGATPAPTTDDQAIDSLLSRLTKTNPIEGEAANTIKPTRGTVEEVVRVLRAMRAAKKWAHWERSFLRKGEEEDVFAPEAEDADELRTTQDDDWEASVGN